MTSTQPQPADAAPIVACTISRDVQNFDLLIEDMENLLGEAWGDLGFSDALPFMSQPEAQHLEFVAVAIDAIDEADLALLTAIIKGAKERGIQVILIAEDVTPASLHQLLRNGADEFVPYPLPEGELAAAVERLRAEPEPVPEPATPQAPQGIKLRGGGDGVLIAVQGIAGGCGATTVAVNLAYELATSAKDKQPRVCLIDLGLQFGSVATYLDLPRRDSVFELLSDVESMDGDSFGQALVSFEGKLQVFTSPADVLPLDMIGRVASLDFFVSIAFMPVSIALAGPLSLLVPIPVIFIIAGVAPPVLALIAMLMGRMRESEMERPMDER